MMIFSTGTEEFPLYFGEWIKHRRQELDLTQVQLAKRARCSVFAIRKIEKGERRPSRQLAELLAKALEIRSEEQTTFIKVARGELSIDRLPSSTHLSSFNSQAAVPPRFIPGNLPRELTPFIGREPELTALGQLLQNPQCSLLTIVGPGGIGKTRLAVAAAQHTEALFPDGVWFVPLVSLSSPVQIVPAIAGGLDFKFQDPTNLQAQLLRYLHTKRALLVLDNAEHLLDGVGVFTEILKDCPQIKLLVISRERLNLLSEWVFDLQGLPVPPNDLVESFDAYSSVALFLQSARRVRAGFELREFERQWVVRICRTMEGMPLGIELSAAWVGLLSCEEIAKEIEHNLDFLSVSMRDLPERHRSLRATLDHSWKLLNAEERLILSRLSVFHGNFSREAAQTICDASLAVLASLMNKSLLYRNDQEYYGLHEIIRQYAKLKLSEDPGEDGRVKDRHASYYVQFLSEWEKALKSSRQVETFNQMAQVIDNLSQGWQHMVTQGLTRAGKSNRFCADLLHNSLFSLSLFYETRCRSLEAIAILTQTVAYLKSIQDAFENTGDNACFCSVLGYISAYLGWHYGWILQYDKARECQEESIRLSEICQSRVGKAQAQFMLSEVAKAQGQLQESASLLEQSSQVFQEEGEDWWYLASLIYLARIYLPLGKLSESEALFQEAFQLIKPGDMYLGLPLRMGLANVYGLKNEYARSEQIMQDCLKLGYLYENNMNIAAIQVILGRIMLVTQRVEQAEKYLKEGINLLSEFGESENLAIALLYIGNCFVIRKNLPAAFEKFQHAIKIGQALHTFWLVYWGLVEIARIYLNEGKTEKTLEIALALRDCPVENTRLQDEGDCLLADLQAALPERQVVVSMQAESKIPPEQAIANVLKYARGLESA
jgi:predicted ATPase/transcriptional regulator with XRE-family HTH domain